MDVRCKAFGPKKKKKVGLPISFLKSILEATAVEKEGTPIYNPIHFNRNFQPFVNIISKSVPNPRTKGKTAGLCVQTVVHGDVSPESATQARGWSVGRITVTEGQRSQRGFCFANS